MFCRHCEERSDEAIHGATQSKNGLLRFARNDGVQSITVVPGKRSATRDP